MGTYTDRHNLYKPTVNETGWGDEVNTNFDTIDAIRDFDSVVEVTGTTYNAESSNSLIVVNAPSNNVTINLPACTDCQVGEVMVIKCFDMLSTVTVNTDGSDTIDETYTSRSTTSKTTPMFLYCDGVDNWWFVGTATAWSIT